VQSADAVLVVSFGGPERREDVMPFLENVVRGRNVPRERLIEVAEHYYHFEGRSPINEQVRGLITALRGELRTNGPDLPVYWGNRNWHPYLADTVRAMAADGIRRAVAFVTSAYSSYSSCRQYRENLIAAREAGGPGAPEIDKIGPFYNHPGFLEAATDRVKEAMAELPGAPVLFTAHSIPTAMAQGCPYESQLRFVCSHIARAVGAPHWDLVWQSRSGPPQVPWLEPDILGWLRVNRPAEVIISPVGFLSSHIEVLWDLDEDAARLCRELRIRMVRARTVDSHPTFISAIRDMVAIHVRGGTSVEPGLCTDVCCPSGRPSRG
jgi:ferrochelatase